MYAAANNKSKMIKKKKKKTKNVQNVAQGLIVDKLRGQSLLKRFCEAHL